MSDLLHSQYWLCSAKWRKIHFGWLWQTIVKFVSTVHDKWLARWRAAPALNGGICKDDEEESKLHKAILRDGLLNAVVALCWFMFLICPSGCDNNYGNRNTNSYPGNYANWSPFLPFVWQAECAYRFRSTTATTPPSSSLIGIWSINVHSITPFHLRFKCAN